MKRALEGVKVCEITSGGVGPFIGTCLADHGAEVVKVESADYPDVSRVSAPYSDGKPGLNRSVSFSVFNTSKRSLGVDLNRKEGLALAVRLVSWSDILVASFSDRVMKKWGLTYDEVRKINPSIVFLHSSAQGLTGPRAESVSWGMMIKGLTGFVHLTGWPDRPAVGPQPAYNDYVAPMFGIAAVMAALDYRRRTGKGQFIELSQYEASLHFIAPALMDYLANGRVQNRSGNECSYAAPHAIYRCKGQDRWCAIAVFDDGEWRAFCAALGNPSWSKEPRFATVGGRKENEVELNRLIEEWTSTRTPEDVMQTLQSAGVAAGVVENAQDLLERDPQLRHRGFYHLLGHSELRPCHHLGWPGQLSTTPAQYQAGPCLGQDNYHVCTELLGYSDDEFVDLQAGGVLQSA